ncbi:MAG: SLBB domain-containing protein [Alphaproteobacteria bacterium]|nr:SLBB domain-containing protein [Alphaproteobacteria bacterium]
MKNLFLALLLLMLSGAGAAFAQTPVPAYAPWNDKYEKLTGLPGDADQAVASPEKKLQQKNAARKTEAEEPEEKPLEKHSPLPQQRSGLEKMYAARVLDEPRQFGYDLFGVPVEETQQKLDRLSESAAMPMGEVQEDFILNSGDEVEVVFSGQRHDRALYKIDSKGLLLIPDFPPIPAAGRSIGQVRVSIDAAAQNLHNTQAYVSLSSVRQIGVLVIGHVRRPGRQTLTVFHTILDALMESGGVQKTGSLRQIRLVRDGRSTIIDLYALLLHGSTNMDLQLRDGDRLIVPPIGPTVAVAGEVKRPGIYELVPVLEGMHADKDRTEKLSLNDMLEFGGGILAPGQNRYLKLEITPEGKEKVDEIKEEFKPLFGDASILVVSKGAEKRAGMVELLGATRKPGLHALAENPSLAKLLRSEDVLGPDAYPLIGVIERWDEDQLTRQLLDFPLRLALKGGYDRRLEDGDIVHLFSLQQIENLAQQTVAANDMPAEDIEPAAGSAPGDEEEETTRITDPAMVSFLKERSAFVRGAVRQGGPYPVAEGTTLDSLLAVAGGLTLEANTSNIEVTSSVLEPGRSGTRRTQVSFRETGPQEVAIGPGDAVRVGQKFQKTAGKSVLVMGEVKNPGRYDLLPGDKVSDLLARTGGLTDDAYADGAIFSRDSERRAEEARFRAQAQDMQRAISAALAEDEEKVDAGKIAEARALAGQLQSAEGIGRITVTADPDRLKAEPELDMLLEPGDRLYIPKRSLNVRVSGEVLSPANLQFRQGKKPRDYIDEAGGFTFDADTDRTFVLYPDGSAQPLQVSSWNYNPVFIPPGSTIVVPRDPKPFDFVESAKNISQILSNLAVTAIFIDDVRDGE